MHMVHNFQVHEYRKNLERLNITDYQIMLAERSGEGGLKKLRGHIISKFFYAFLLFPLSFLAFLFNSPIILLARYWNKRTPFEEERSQGKLLIIALFMPVYYSAVLALTLFLFGFTIFIYMLLLLPTLGFFIIVFVQSERQTFSHLKKLLWLSLLLYNSGAHLKELMEQRKQIKSILTELAKQWLREKGLKSMLSGIESGTIAVPYE